MGQCNEGEIRSMKKLLDANAILRFLLNDNEEMAKQTEIVIKNGAFAKEVVIAEVIYVLCGVYKIERPLVSAKIIELLKFIEIENPEVLNNAMEIFSEFYQLNRKMPVYVLFEELFVL